MNNSVCLVGSTFGGAKIDFGMFGSFIVELILPQQKILLEARNCSF
jgi:hypothetical protein